MDFCPIDGDDDEDDPGIGWGAANDTQTGLDIESIGIFKAIGVLQGVSHRVRACT